MKHLLFGILLGLLAAYPHLAMQGAAPIEAAARCALGLPIVWAFAAGLLARPRVARLLPRRTR